MLAACNCQFATCFLPEDACHLLFATCFLSVTTCQMPFGASYMACARCHMLDDAFKLFSKYFKNIIVTGQVLLSKTIVKLNLSYLSSLRGGGEVGVNRLLKSILKTT